MMIKLLLLAVAAGLALCVYLFLSLKLEFSALEKRQKALGLSIQRIQLAIEELRVGLREAEERAGVLVPPTPPRSGLNLNTRTQALRMLRRGDRPEQIAAALRVPENEIRLLLKVHQLAAQDHEPATA